jgi:preprotein translocase subunit SecB
MSDEKPAQQLEILKIYLKDVSLETPHAPQIFNEQRTPEINVQLSNNSSPVAENVHEVVLTLTVTATVEEKTAYLVEVHQAGVFAVRGLSNEQLGPILGAFCPNTLFPFARETVASLIGKSGFPPLLLNPVNFDVLYKQRLQQVQQEQQRTQPSPQAEIKH